MSEFSPRVAKRTRKPSAKASASRAGGKRRSAKSSLAVPSLEAHVSSDSVPVDNAQPNPGSLSDIHRELISLREQVTKLKASSPETRDTTSMVPVSSAASSKADLLPITSPPSVVFPPAPSSSTFPLVSSPPAVIQDRPTSPMSLPTQSALPNSSDFTAGLLPAEDLLAARDSDSDSDGGEPSSARASRKLRKKTMSLSGSLGASLFSGMGPLSSFSPSSHSQIDPRLKLRILKNLFVPFEVLVAADQGKSVHHYLRNPFLTPHNDHKLRVFYPKLTFETWAEGLNIYMLVWTETHPEDARPLMQYMQMIRNMAKVFPPAVWLNYDCKFRILRQQHSFLPWHVPLPQLYFQQLMKVSPFGAKGGESFISGRDKPWNSDTFKDRGNFFDLRHNSNSDSNVKQWDNKFFRRGYCSHYNLHGTCKRLPKCASLAHRCALCEGPHGATNCKKSSGGFSQSNNTTSAPAAAFSKSIVPAVSQARQ